MCQSTRQQFSWQRWRPVGHHLGREGYEEVRRGRFVRWRRLQLRFSENVIKNILDLLERIATLPSLAHGERTELGMEILMETWMR